MHPNARTAHAWVEAFNAHDVPRLVALYAPNARHVSPKLRARGGEGAITGHAALTSWWLDAVRRLPSLRYELTSVTADDARVFIEYVRHVDGEPPMAVAEVFDVVDGLIVHSRVYHG
jgi:limonene-1,2-epoxide hydrolase